MIIDLVANLFFKPFVLNAPFLKIWFAKTMRFYVSKGKSVKG